MYENKHERLLPMHLFLKRASRSFVIGFSMIILCLGVGMIGFHYLEKMPWEDAYVNSAMTLSGMGPMAELKTFEGKIFASSYALFSGILFLVIMSIILGPAIHRTFHKFHIENAEETSKDRD